MISSFPSRTCKPMQYILSTELNSIFHCSDISGNPLVCNCNLLWLNAWSTANRSVSLTRQPKCEAPSTFKGMPIKRIRVGVDLHCDSQLQTQLELYPESDQLVFEGDSLSLRCMAPRVAVGTKMDSEDLPTRAHVFWGWSPLIIPFDSDNNTENITFFEPISHFPSTITIEATPISDSGLLNSILKIPVVAQNHSGMWNCRLRSQQANFSRSIAIVVISKMSKFCSAQETIDNKGTYSWPRTLRGNVVALTCTGDGPPNVHAYHSCNDSGMWTNLDTNECPFIKESTKILDLFSKDNLTLSKVQIIERAKRLRNYTDISTLLANHTDFNKFTDPIDIVFITKTMLNYLEVLRSEPELGSVLLDIVSELMNYPRDLLRKSQNMAATCNKIVHVAETSANFTPPPNAKKNNLAMEVFDIRPDSFSGKSCVWFKSNIIQPDGKTSDKRTLQCNIGNSAQSIGFYDKHFDASIQFPATLFTHVSSATSTQKLLVSVFQNSNLFPQNKAPYKITSCVIGAKLISSYHHRSRENLTEPIFIMLRANPFHHELSAPKPVWWDPDLNQGLGGWSLQGCLFTHMLQGMLVFACTKLGYYGLIQHTKYLNDSPDENSGARFRLSPPAIYVGSFILFVCLWVNIATYLIYGRCIQMARKAKHALINTWLSLSLLIVIFNVGVFQTENSKVCQSFGILIHYFSLCVLFWMCVSVSSMMKRMGKQRSDEPKELEVSRKPILGIYLVGYGIALIICGISGAVNIREYASYSQCFVKTGPALSAVFVPGVIVILFLCLLFICIRCNLKERDINGRMSEGTQGTENVDLDLLETNNNINHQMPHHYQRISISTPTTATFSSNDDLENTYSKQLKAFVFMLIFYLASWLSAAMTVAMPFSEKILYEKEVFSVTYALIAAILGLFILFFYGIARSDVRNQWSLFNGNKKCCRPRSVADTNELNGGPIVVSFRPQLPNEVVLNNNNNTLRTSYSVNHSISRSNSQSSKQRVSFINGCSN